MRLLSPKVVAVAGASPRPDSVGGQILLNLLKKFQGEVYPVNPRYDAATVGSREVKFYGSVSQLPKRPDVVVVATPAHVAPQVVEDSGRAGAEAVVVISGGFAEVGREDLEGELLRAARRHGVRILGPNCVGIYNAYVGFDTMFLPEDKAPRPQAGGIALISQSGAVMTAALDWAAGEGFGVGIAVNIGNRLDLAEWDILQMLEEVREVKAVAVYIEGFRWRGDGAKFLKAVKNSSKLVAVYKAGRGAGGQRAAKSHTAAMAGSYEIYRGVFRQAGAAEVDGLVELIDAARALELYGPASVRSVLVVSSSGGLAVQIVDALNEAGLDTPEMPPEAAEELKKELPPVATTANPVDITGSGVDRHFRAALEVGLRHFDAAVVAALIHPPGLSERVADEIIDAYEKFGKPVIVVSFGSSPKVKTMEERLKRRLLVVNTPRRAAAALSAVAFHGSKVYHRRH